MEVINISTLMKFFIEEKNKYMNEDRFTQNKEMALKTVSQAIYWSVMFFDAAKKIHAARFNNHVTQNNLDNLKNGIIYARNRVTHQFPLLLKITDGAQYPMVLPSPYFEISWKSIDELPEADAKFDYQIQREGYINSLANSPVRFTLGSLSLLFEKVVDDQNFQE